MPAFVTHTLFAHMALQALREARHPLASIAETHAGLFRTAAIAGCDIQCMPYQVCRHCNAPYRHDQEENRRCLVCGREKLEDFVFQVSDGHRLKRRDIERDLYGNTHLVLHRKYLGYGVRSGAPPGPAEQPFPEQVVRHVANALHDGERVAGRKSQTENYFAFVLGWLAHVVSDAIFKGVYLHAARVNFFGFQYNMAMLPAAETLTMTDIAHDFGVRWPAWHEQLIHDEPDGGALKHLAMGDSSDAYDQQRWTSEFGKPDPAIGRVLDALRPINRTWFHRMYLPPDYSAATPRLDRHISTRTTWRFGTEQLDLGQLRRYAIGTGWYGAFIKGVQIYLRIATIAAREAGIVDPPPTNKSKPRRDTTAARANWSLWERIVSEAASRGGERPRNWGSELHIDAEAAGVLRRLRNARAHVVGPSNPNEYQREVLQTLQRELKVANDSRASVRIVVGSPGINPAALDILCTEDALRLKYDDGYAGLVRLAADGRTVLLAGFSEFGEQQLVQKLRQFAAA
jgi:hypothetical protein